MKQSACGWSIKQGGRICTRPKGHSGFHDATAPDRLWVRYCPDGSLSPYIWTEGDVEYRVDREVQELKKIITDLTDPDPCSFDHHGYCQAHGWFDVEPKCPHARAKEIIAKRQGRESTESEET